MNALIDQAIAALAQLPQEQQDAIAREILERVAADARWEAALADPRSEAVLQRLADDARAEVARGEAQDRDPADVPPHNQR